LKCIAQIQPVVTMSHSLSVCGAHRWTDQDAVWGLTGMDQATKVTVH